MKKAVKKLSEELGLPEKTIIEMYKAYWSFIRETINSLPLLDVTEEQFNKLKVNFNVHKLGKFYCTYRRIEHYKNFTKNYKERKSHEDKKDKASV